MRSPISPSGGRPGLPKGDAGAADEAGGMGDVARRADHRGAEAAPAAAGRGNARGSAGRAPRWVGGDVGFCSPLGSCREGGGRARLRPFAGPQKLHF